MPLSSFQSQQWHCPICGEHLTPVESLDSAMPQLSCRLDHRFFATDYVNSSNAPERASRLSLMQLDGKSPEQVASFWLSDPTARAHLNDQLAALLAAFLENREAVKEFQPSYCPVCGNPLTSEEQPDIWVTGLCCAQGHQWGERGSHLGGLINGRHITFNAELSNFALVSLASAWLKHEPHIEEQLHHSLRPVLEALLMQRRE